MHKYENVSKSQHAKHEEEKTLLPVCSVTTIKLATWMVQT